MWEGVGRVHEAFRKVWVPLVLDIKRRMDEPSLVQNDHRLVLCVMLDQVGELWFGFLHCSLFGWKVVCFSNLDTFISYKHSDGVASTSSFSRNAVFLLLVLELLAILYTTIYFSLWNLDLINTFPKRVPKKFFWDKITNKVYNWSHSHGYIDGFYETSLMNQHIFFDTQVIDRILSGFGVMSFVYKGK